MNRSVRARQAVGIALWLVLVVAVSARWVGLAQQTTPPAAAGPRFTGKSDMMEPTNLAVSRRRFEAGARSAWHSHDNGQLLFVEEGRMRTQKRGQEMKELGQHESDYTGPNVQHWHGAVPGQPFVQVALAFGGDTKWLDDTTEDQYQGKAR